MNINDLQYGNPSRDIADLVQIPTFLDTVFTEASQLDFPANDSQVTKEELNALVNDMLEVIDNEPMLKRYRVYDYSLYGYLCEFSFKEDHQATFKYKETITSIFNDVRPLVAKLKMHHQRPRPFQLAGAHKLKFFPYPTFSAHSPSFPSMHVCLGAVIFGVCGNLYPNLYPYFKNLSNDIMHSRRMLGVAFQSDLDAGLYVSEKILENKEFIIKYKL